MYVYSTRRERSWETLWRTIDAWIVPYYSFVSFLFYPFDTTRSLSICTVRFAIVVVKKRYQLDLRNRMSRVSDPQLFYSFFIFKLSLPGYVMHQKLYMQASGLSRVFRMGNSDKLEWSGERPDSEKKVLHVRWRIVTKIDKSCYYHGGIALCFFVYWNGHHASYHAI